MWLNRTVTPNSLQHIGPARQGRETARARLVRQARWPGRPLSGRVLRLRPVAPRHVRVVVLAPPAAGGRRERAVPAVRGRQAHRLRGGPVQGRARCRALTPAREGQQIRGRRAGKLAEVGVGGGGASESRDQSLHAVGRRKRMGNSRGRGSRRWRWAHSSARSWNPARRSMSTDGMAGKVRAVAILNLDNVRISTTARGEAQCRHLRARRVSYVKGVPKNLKSVLPGHLPYCPPFLGVFQHRLLLRVYG